MVCHFITCVDEHANQERSGRINLASTLAQNRLFFRNLNIAEHKWIRTHDVRFAALDG
jgi:hypothetical protein